MMTVSAYGPVSQHILATSGTFWLDGASGHASTRSIMSSLLFGAVVLDKLIGGAHTSLLIVKCIIDVLHGI